MNIRDAPLSDPTRASDSRWSGLRAALVAVAPYVLLGVLPLLLWAGLFADSVDRHALAFDFDRHTYPQVRDLIEGRTPATAYPPLAIIIFVPLGFVPIGVADVLATLLMVACAVATLWLLDIRDWRCYGAAAYWLPVWGTVQTANISLLLTLGAAVAWRYRDRALPCGAAVAIVIAAKLFLWPLALWLAATRRWKATAMMVGMGLLASASAWAVLGFDGLRRFPSLVRANVVDNGEKPYTLVSVFQQFGTSDVVAYAACWTVGAAVLVVAIRAALRGRDAAAFSLCIGAALLLSPIVWSHYLAVLLVPVALTRPRFSLLWLAPLPLWVCPPIDAAMPQKLLLLFTGAAIVAYCARELTRGRPSAAPEMA
jgi:hypothetical protein